jgi:hypothetical protein
MWLQVTQIGKQVNGLRKWGGKVSSRAKALVKKWKQLIPETEVDSPKKHGTDPELRSRLEPSVSMSEPEQSRMKHGYVVLPRKEHRSEVKSGKSRTAPKEGHGSGMESLVPTSSRNSMIPAESFMEGRSRAAVRGPVICIDSGDSEGSVVEIPRSTASHHKHKRHKDKKKKRASECQVSDEFSRALEVPRPNTVGGYQREVHPLATDSRSQQTAEEQEDVVLVEQSYAPASQERRDRSPAAVPPPRPGRKRTGTWVWTDVCSCLAVSLFRSGVATGGWDWPNQEVTNPSLLRKENSDWPSR